VEKVQYESGKGRVCDPRPPSTNVMSEIILLVNSSSTDHILVNLLLQAGFDVRSGIGAGVVSTLLDSTMPGAILVNLDHVEVPPLSTFLQVKRLAPNTATIVLSSNTEVETKVRLLELGADDYIQEPFEPQELLARVRSFVRRTKLWA
jgi:two-component system, OmpR family, phosphate regulon response regulator OmpR